MDLHDLTEQDGFAVSRRGLLRFALAGSLGAMAGASLLAPFRMAWAKGDDKKYGPNGKKDEKGEERRTITGYSPKVKSIIFLYMAGGPSHIDTWDPKPGRETGGSFKAIEVEGMGDARISEHFPRLAKQGKRLSIIRSMTSKEGSHDRARYLMITGYRPQGAVEHPMLGAIMAKEHPRTDFDLPQNIAIGGGGGGPGAGFLGARFAPFLVGDPTRPVQDLSLPANIDDERFERRRKLLQEIEKRFEEDRGDGKLGETHRDVYEKAERLIKSPLAKLFDLSTEKQEVREAYGTGRFGQGCLLARRLVETGVPFVEVTLGGWDTHKNNFEQVEKLSKDVDPGMATLIQDLADRNLLDSTLVVWGGEFGRTPKIRDGGRDHYPKAFSVALAGGGVPGGRAIGATDQDGAEVKDRPITVPDLHATFAVLAGHDPDKQNESGLGRPIRIVDKDGKPVKELLS